MKIAPKDAERRINAFPDDGLVAILCYGKDAGRIAMMRDALTARFLAAAPRGEVYKKNFSDYKSDAAAFRDELYAASFFSDRKLFVLRDCPASLPADFKEILSGYAGGDRIVLIADDLPTASGLRKFAEAAPNIGAIACYVDESGDLAAFVREFMRENGAAIDADAVRAIAQSLPGDRMVVMRELEKLLLYKHGDAGAISLKDAEAVIDVESAAPLSKLCRAVLSCNAKQANLIFRDICEDGTHGVAIFRALARSAQTLEGISLNIAAGMDADAAIKACRPPVFFRDIPAVRAELRLWDIAALTQLRQLLLEVEGALKSSESEADVTAERGLAQVMRLAARCAKR